MAVDFETFRSWTQSLNHDAGAFLRLFDEPAAPDAARSIAAGALGYLISRMDLIPDWNADIGTVDDAMVLRVCAQSLAGASFGQLPAADVATLGRLANEASTVATFMQPDLFAAFRRFCDKLSTAPVRGRTPQQLLADTEVARSFRTEVSEELSKAVVMSDVPAPDALLRLTSHLVQKLQ